MRCVNRSSLFSSDYCSKIIRANFRLGVVVKRSFSPLWEQRNKLCSSRGESHHTRSKKIPPGWSCDGNASPEFSSTTANIHFCAFFELGDINHQQVSTSTIPGSFFLNVSKKKTFLQNSSHSNQNSFKKNPPQNEPKKEEIVGRLAKTFPLW